MRNIDLDWRDFFSALAPWEMLTAETRRVLLERVKPSQPVLAKELGKHLDFLTQAGFLPPFQTSPFALKKELQPFQRVMRGLNRLLGYEARGFEGFHLYMSEFFTPAEKQAFGIPTYGDAVKHIYKKVTAKNWPNEFLSAQDASWEDEYVANARSFLPEKFLTSSEVFHAAQSIVKKLMEAEPIPFRELPNQLPGMRDEVLAAAIAAGVRYLFLFPRLQKGSLEPVLGTWPQANKKEVAALDPRPNEVTQVFELSYLAADIAVLLTACAAQPQRVKMDSFYVDLFAKARKEIAANFVGLTAWVEDNFKLKPEIRLESALHMCVLLGLIERSSRSKEIPRAQPTAAGLAWLALGPKERLKSLIEKLRKDPDRLWLPEPLQLRHVTGSMDLNQEVNRAFQRLDGKGFLKISEFLPARATGDNPLLELLDYRYYSIQIGRKWLQSPTEEDLESTWIEILSDFLQTRLLPLGGIRLGIAADGLVAGELTSVGRYMTGLATDFEILTAAGEVVVQPNFDVAFLSPAPQAEIELARFAERKGRSLGVLFRITKKSIMNAAAAGLTAEEVMDTLKRVCSRDVPPNVAREIQGWFAYCRRIQLRPAVVIDCPDKDTAARVIAASGGAVAPITDTKLELTDPAQQAALLRKLRELGVFG